MPAIWRALAHQPRVLETTWHKDRLIMTAGTLDELDKGCAALAVAQFRQSANVIAHGMRLHPPVADITAADVAPGGSLEHIVPVAARRTNPDSR